MCKANEQVASNVCVPCPVGYVNEGGDNPAGADTVCDGDGTGGLVGPCDAGYHPSAVGDACVWNPYCEIAVGDYANPQNGTVGTCVGKVLDGKACSFACDPGFELKADKGKKTSAQCVKHTMLKEMSATCEPAVCNVKTSVLPANAAHGTCKVLTASFAMGSAHEDRLVLASGEGCTLGCAGDYLMKGKPVPLSCSYGVMNSDFSVTCETNPTNLYIIIGITSLVVVIPLIIVAINYVRSYLRYKSAVNEGYDFDGMGNKVLAGGILGGGGPATVDLET
jgi:hypothetical protein